MDCSPPASSLHGILQARILEWVATSSSRGMFPTQGWNPRLLLCRQIALHCRKLPWWLRRQSVFLQCGIPGFDPWVEKMPWRRKWQPTPVFLTGNPMNEGGWWAHKEVTKSPWGRKESDTTERFHFHFTEPPEEEGRRDLAGFGFAFVSSV